MDLDFNGYPELAEHTLMRTWPRRATPSRGVALRLLSCVRSRQVISFRLDDAGISQADRDEAALVARKYFELAFRYAARFERPTGDGGWAHGYEQNTWPQPWLDRCRPRSSAQMW